MEMVIMDQSFAEAYKTITADFGVEYSSKGPVANFVRSGVKSAITNSIYTDPAFALAKCHLTLLADANGRVTAVEVLTNSNGLDPILKKCYGESLGSLAVVTHALPCGPQTGAE